MTYVASFMIALYVMGLSVGTCYGQTFCIRGVDGSDSMSLSRSRISSEFYTSVLATASISELLQHEQIENSLPWYFNLKMCKRIQSTIYIDSGGGGSGTQI